MKNVISGEFFWFDMNNSLENCTSSTIADAHLPGSKYFTISIHKQISIHQNKYK
jgi:hypothetical protein